MKRKDDKISQGKIRSRLEFVMDHMSESREGGPAGGTLTLINKYYNTCVSVYYS